MREFFRGWRPKVGCIALVVTCAFLTMWLRSYVFVDLIGFWANAQTLQRLDSNHGSLCWTTVTLIQPQSNWSVRPYWNRTDRSKSASIENYAQWQWTYFGFRYGAEHEEQLYIRVCRAVPYGFITTPLMFFSMYLLLSKPWPKTRVSREIQIPPSSQP